MTTYSLRCRVDKCRHRRVSKRHPDDYKRAPKCPRCGSTNGWRIEARAYNKRGLCNCSGPECVQEHGKSFPHRVTHPLCDKHPHGPYNQLKQRGVSDDDIPLEINRPQEQGECPF